MITITEHIDRIRLKLQALVKDHHALQKENDKLRAEMSRKAVIEMEMKEKTQALDQQVSILKASTGQMDEASKKLSKSNLTITSKRSTVVSPC